MRIRRKSLLYRQFMTYSDKNHYLKSLSNLIKTITLNANIKEIVKFTDSL